jgi:hypothetical protein
MPSKPFFPNSSLKENVLILMVFGIPGWSLVISNFLDLSKSRKVCVCLILASLFSLTLGLVGMSDGIHAINFQFITCLSFITLTISIDSYLGNFWNNALLHLVNTGYLGVGLYFFIMNLYPDSFPLLWKSIFPSAPKAFDMLILCMFYQTIGYYLVWALFYPISNSIKKWAISPKNLLNFSFPGSSSCLPALFGVFTILGLASRLWNLSLGNVYYTEGSGVPFFISSFLGQFDRLYSVALLYGCALSFTENNKKSSIVKLTWFFVAFEFIYQLLSGSKGRFFYFVILPISSVFVLVTRRISWGILLVLSGAGLFSWLVVYPILVIYRNLLSDSALGSSIDPVELLNQASQVLQMYSWEQYVDIILTPFNKSGIAEQVTAMTSIIHYNLSQKSSLLWQRLLLFWVPRFIWSEKPVALSSNLIGRLSQRVTEHDMKTAVLTTAPGELFLYYGLWGSSLMILMGLVLRFLNETMSPFKFFTIFRVALLVSYLPLAQGILGGSFESGLTGIVLQVGTLYAALLIIKIMMQPRWE